jgi:FixJ family two-component response regulator
MTGTELAAAIATLRPELPVILATGYADLAAAIDPGLLRLSRPFSQAALANALREARAPDPSRV